MRGNYGLVVFLLLGDSVAGEGGGEPSTWLSAKTFLVR